MIELILVVFTWIPFAIIHELGHLLCALALRLKIQGWGYHIIPLPSFFVSIKRSNRSWKNFCFLLAGNLTTLFLLIFVAMFEDSMDKCIVMALLLQFVMEYNPFYSDIVLLVSKVYHSTNDIKCSLKSYFHSYRFIGLLISWMMLIVLIFNFNF